MSNWVCNSKSDPRACSKKCTNSLLERGLCLQQCCWAPKLRLAESAGLIRRVRALETQPCFGKCRWSISSLVARPSNLERTIKTCDTSSATSNPSSAKLYVTDDQQEVFGSGQRPTTNDQRRFNTYAITSSPPRSFSSTIACSSAAMAHSACSSDGGCVVIRCSHSPGAVITANSDFRCLAAKRIISYETPVITGSNAMRTANRAQNVVTGTSM